MDLNKISAGCPSTQLTYLKEMDLKKVTCEIIRLAPDKGNQYYFVLDRTIFHPKGGGQPSDMGILRGPNFEAGVKKVIDHDGVIVHWAKMIAGTPTLGQIDCELNWNRRFAIMRRHSAAHLIDHCLAQTLGSPVQTTDSWLDEFSYLGYVGRPLKHASVNQVFDLANQMITKDASISISYVDRADVKSLSSAPNYERLPNLQEIRVVKIEGCAPIPCGGTHVARLSQIGQLSPLGSVCSSKSSFRLYFMLGNP